MNQIRIRIEYRDADGSHHAWEYPQEGYFLKDIEITRGPDSPRGPHKIIYKGRPEEIVITQEVVGNFGFTVRPYSKIERITFDLDSVTWKYIEAPWKVRDE